jgi:hypothetical protein
MLTDRKVEKFPKPCPFEEDQNTPIFALKKKGAFDSESEDGSSKSPGLLKSEIALEKMLTLDK